MPCPYHWQLLPSFRPEVSNPCVSFHAEEGNLKKIHLIKPRTFITGIVISSTIWLPAKICNSNQITFMPYDTITIGYSGFM